MADITYKTTGAFVLFEGQTAKGKYIIKNVRGDGHSLRLTVAEHNFKPVIDIFRKACTVAKYKPLSPQDAYAKAGAIFEGC